MNTEKPISDCKGYTIRQVKDDGTNSRELIRGRDGSAVFSKQEAEKYVQELLVISPTSKFVIL